jgi:hypothetical protein
VAITRDTLTFDLEGVKNGMASFLVFGHMPFLKSVHSPCGQTKLPKNDRCRLNVNTIETTPPRGSIAVITAACGTGAQFAVRDTGLGIPPAHLVRSSLKDFNTTKPRELGLRSVISHKIVDQSGGAISIISHIGRGTTSVIELKKTETRPFPKAVTAS